MSKDIAADLAARATEVSDQMQSIEDMYGSDRSGWPAGQVERYDRLKTGFGRLVTEMEDADRAERDRTRADKIASIRAAAQNPAMVEAGFHAPGADDGSRRRTNPWATGSGDDLARLDSPTGLHARAMDAIEYAYGLPAAGRSRLVDMLDREPDPSAATLVIAATSDAYRSAFGKVIVDSQRGHLLWTPAEREAYARVEAARAAMSLTDANGGYLVPFALDPTIMLTNDGAANPFRAVSRVEITAGDEWAGVTSAGITAEWLAEAAEAADASPAFGRLSIPMHKGAAAIIASFEIAQDSNIAAQLPSLIADAKARQEAAAFATGSGSGAPLGVVAAVTAVTASRVTPTTAGTFAAQSEVYKVWDALPASARQSPNVAWVANNATISRIRQFDTTGGSAWIANLGEGKPPTLIGAPLLEASAMDSAVTTGSNILLAGDFREFIIVDRLGVVVTDVPMLTGANGRPTYQRMWAAHWRVGSACAAPSKFRVLKL